MRKKIDHQFKTQKKPRGKNKSYVLVETFETKIEFESYWSENQFDDLYYHHSGRAINIGSEEIFRCRNYNKLGFQRCYMQAKTIFPGKDDSVQLHLTSDEHTHARLLN